ncbi:hypothetical protein B0H13DRAFT_2088448 [Mycena leptocephala]|nr:hypothetical protein B0H13DRAFT_2088448 [Mycena leptocephala]
MSGLFVIVDDQDPDIHYSMGWAPIPAAISFEYGGTITSPGPQGSTAEYNFNGTSISVFARVAANRNNATNLLNFVIDGTILDSEILQTNQFERFHEKVYTSPTLADGPHNMVITLNTTSGDVFLDYMIYEVSPNTPIGSSSRLLVLNTNEQLAYSLGWNSGVVLKPGLEKGAVSLNDTVQGAADLGATVALNFTGTGFEVHGLLVTPFPSPVAAYSLDGGPLTNVEMPPNGTDFTNAVSNFEFIGETFNEVGTHSLVITPLIPGAFFLDYMIIESPAAFFPQKAQIAAVPKPAATKSIQLDAGAVAAIILGIILGFLLVSVGWYFIRRRQKIRERSRSENGRRPDMEHGSSNFTPYAVVAPARNAFSKRDRLHQPGPTTRADVSRQHAILPPAYSDRAMTQINGS